MLRNDNELDNWVKNYDINHSQRKEEEIVVQSWVIG